MTCRYVLVAALAFGCSGERITFDDEPDSGAETAPDAAVGRGDVDSGEPGSGRMDARASDRDAPDVILDDAGNEYACVIEMEGEECDDGKCLGTCDMPDPGECEGTCFGACDGSCDILDNGECAGHCDGYCAGSCETNEPTECNQGCTGECLIHNTELGRLICQ